MGDDDNYGGAFDDPSSSTDSDTNSDWSNSWGTEADYSHSTDPNYDY